MNTCSLCRCSIVDEPVTDAFENVFCSQACMNEAYDIDIDAVWLELCNDRFERDGNYIYYHFNDSITITFGDVDGPFGYTLWDDGEARDSGETPSTNVKEIASWIINTVRQYNGIDTVAVL